MVTVSPSETPTTFPVFFDNWRSSNGKYYQGQDNIEHPQYREHHED
jgi:hypothetical protein